MSKEKCKINNNEIEVEHSTINLYEFINFINKNKNDNECIYIFLYKTNLAKEIFETAKSFLNGCLDKKWPIEENINIKHYETTYNDIRILIFVEDDQGNSSNTSNKINIIHTSKLSNLKINEEINEIHIDKKIVEYIKDNKSSIELNEQNEISNTSLEEGSFISTFLSFIIKLLISLIPEVKNIKSKGNKI